MGVQIPPWEGAIFCKGCPIVKYSALYGHLLKTAKPIEMPFGLWAWMGQRNHVLDGGPQVLKDVAMASNFWLSMGYNVGCVIASDTLLDSRGGFSGSSYAIKI